LDPSKKNEIVTQLHKIIADVRTSEEAKEGFSAFLEKRKPNW